MKKTVAFLVVMSIFIFIYYLFASDFYETNSVHVNELNMQEHVDTPAFPSTGKIKVYGIQDDDFTVLESITDLGVKNRFNQDSFRIARNTSGGSLAKGTVVYYSGSTGNKPNFSAARANSITTMPAIGILGTAVANNTFGEVMIIGLIENIKTDYTTLSDPNHAPVADWAEGDELYVNENLPGKLQNSKPTHPSFSQWIASIEVVHATQGILLVKTQAMLGLEDGTNSNTFTIGDTSAGTKSLKFDATSDAQIDWTGIEFTLAEKVTVNSITTANFVADPCANAGTGELSTGAWFYNSTDNRPCYCDENGDDRLMDDSAACF